MNYTNGKRRELNAELRGRVFGLDIEEDKENGVPVIQMKKLPEQARQVESIKELSQLLPYDNRAWRRVIPVFVESQRMERGGSTFVSYYRINYVNCSASSMEQAAEYIAEGKLFWIPGLKIEKYGK